jgi:hypothetical protein
MMYPMDPKGNIQSSVWINTSPKTEKQYIIIRFTKSYLNSYGKWVNNSMLLDTKEIYWLKAAVEAAILKMGRIRSQAPIILPREQEVKFMKIKIENVGNGPELWQRHEKCICCHAAFNYKGAHRNPCICDSCLKRITVSETEEDLEAQ